MWTYFLSFRIADRVVQKGTYQQRYRNLDEHIKNISDGYWMVPTSFWFFSSTWTREQIVALIKTVLDSRYDEAVVGMTDYKGISVIGATNENVAVLRSLIADLDVE